MAVGECLLSVPVPKQSFGRSYSKTKLPESYFPSHFVIWVLSVSDFKYYTWSEKDTGNPVRSVTVRFTSLP